MPCPRIRRAHPPPPPRFAELAAYSNFTFLTGASHMEEIVARAAALGLQSVAAADCNTLAGVVRGHVAARDLKKRAETQLREKTGVSTSDVMTRALEGAPLSRDKIDPSGRVMVMGAAPKLDHAPGWDGRFLVATRLRLQDSACDWIALPTDRAAYGRLCRLLTLGKRRAAKGDCVLFLRDLEAWREGLILLAAPPDPLTGAQGVSEVRSIAEAAPEEVFLLARPAYDGQDAARLDAYAAIAENAAAPMVATANPIMHIAARRRLADILSCIRLRRSIDRLGADAQPNAERRLRSAEEMLRLFAGHERAVARTVEIADRISFSLEQLRYEYPDEVSIDPVTGAHEAPQERLERLAWEGLARRYPDGAPQSAKSQCRHELRLIGKLEYAPYFLTVHDVVAFARGRGILVQGRGSAANSIICYALGVTEIGPHIASMVFERFVSEARNEPPDIDVDFEHERREEVIQHIYERYGRHRAGLCATVIHFRSRAAVREVGQAMGLSADVIAAISSQSWGGYDDPTEEARLREIGLDPTDRRLRQTLALVREIIGFPRHLSQHVGGFVMTQGRLDELAPIENAAMEDRTVIEWDKDDIDALGILKVDVLALGMLTCLRKAFDLLADYHGVRHTLASLPPEEPEVYEMLSAGDAIGVFQVESRAQINFLPRMKPECFYDLVIEVAIVRPGPIQGNMVHPYLRRRQGAEKVSFPSKELEGVLGKTLGVPLFQEQAMQIAMVAADFSPEEADQLRRALATFRKSGTIHTFRERFVNGMVARKYEPEFAERCFSQIEGFGEYGFPESHAASFALLVYASAWFKRWHPAIFTTALLNSQPMGFYAPAQLLRDAKNHGVELRPICVNASFWDYTLEPDGRGAWAIRLGFRQIKGVSKEDAAQLVERRGNGYRAPEDLARRAGLSRRTIGRLAEADAFATLGLSRRAAQWDARAALPPPPLFARLLEGEGGEEPPYMPPLESEGEAIVGDYRSTRLTLRRHPAALVREMLRAERSKALTPTEELPQRPDRASATIIGVVTVRQRPGSAKGVIFLTVEDETASANVVVWPPIYQRFRRAIIAGRFLRITGRIQRDPISQVTHLVAQKVEDISDRLDQLGSSRCAPQTAYADEVQRPVHPRPTSAAGRRHPRDQAKALFPSRDFH